MLFLSCNKVSKQWNKCNKSQDLAACTKSVSIVSERSGTISASAKSTLRCLVWPGGDGDDRQGLRLSSTPTLGSELTLEPWRWMSLADTDTGELKPLDVGVSGVSGRYGDLAVDVTGLWSSRFSETRWSLTVLTQTSVTCDNQPQLKCQITLISNR